MLLLYCAAAGVAGAAAAAQEFGAASVRPNRAGNAGGEGSERESIQISPTSLTMRNVSLRSCLRWAYDLRDEQISGPGWLASERYDISATSEAETPVGAMKAMLQKLLTERFTMVVRRETKDVTVYSMTVRKPGKLRKAAAATPPGDPTALPVGGSMEFRNYTMENLAARLASRPFRLERIVIDKTGLLGAYSFSIRFADDAAAMKHTLEGMERGSVDGGLPSMITLLEEQLGLRFQTMKAPVSSLAVERAEKVPLAN